MIIKNFNTFFRSLKIKPIMKKIILTAVSIISVVTSSQAQLNLVSDIYPIPSSSIPDWLYVYDNKVFFTADDATNGIEIWTYDGTNAPALFADINTSGSSVGSAHFCEFNGKLYFQGYEGTYGNELYEYDGVNPPVRITDINPGGANSIPSEMTVFNGKLYFSGVGPGNDYEFYVYDGINPVTLVADINTTGNSFPYRFKEFNGKLYFGASNGGNGSELWEYDGINPPVMLSDINSGPNSSYPDDFTVCNNKLYFSAENGINGRELWMYDGVNPPSMVVDMTAGATSFDPKRFYNYNGTLIFSGIDPVAGNELWKYDGVNNPTLVFDINTNPSMGLHNAHPRHFIEYNNLLYFRATDETHGREIWAWDGVNNPVFIVDINPGTAHSSDDWNLSTTKRMVELNGKLIFPADNGVVGEELFEYTGCLADTDVTEANLVLTATQTGVSYQWINCEDSTLISGETNQTFTPSADGNYAVIITNGACIDTSSCFTIQGLGINNSESNNVLIYPNPADDILVIETSEKIEQVNIYSMNGEMIMTSTQNKIDVANLTAGMYLISLKTDSGISFKKFIKK